MTAPDLTTTRIRTALSELAEHGDTVALYLRLCGDRGQPRSPYACPIAVHLHRTVGVWVGIESSGWSFHGRHGFRWGGLPPEVERFVREFDAGEHPQLITSADEMELTR